MRVLLVRAGALGDVLLLRSTIAGLHAAGHEPFLLAPSLPAAALLGPGPSEVRALFSWDDPALARWLGDPSAPLPYDDALSSIDAALVFTRSPELAARLRSVVPRSTVRDPEPQMGHAAAWIAEAARDLGAVTVPVPPDMMPTQEERAAARPILDQLPPRFLAIHPGSGSPVKNWPAPRFAQVARLLAPGRPWLLVSGPADDAAVAALGAVPDAVHARSLPPRILGAVLRESGSFVGHDSGVSHLAAAYGAPVLALFGPTDPAIWAPIGRRVQVLRAPSQRLDELSADEVVARARTMR